MVDDNAPSTLRRRSVANRDLATDLKDPDLHLRGDLAAIYQKLRQDAPVQWNPEVDGRGFWSVLDYDLVSLVVKNPATFSSDFRRGGIRIFDAHDASSSPRPILLSLDPPDHTHFRRALRSLFEEGAVQQALPRLRARAAGLIAAIAPKGKADFVSEVALPFTVGLLTDMLEAPPSDGMKMANWVKVMMGDDDPDLQMTPAQRQVEMEDFDKYFLALIDQDAASGKDGILNRLSKVTFEGVPIDRPTVLANIAAFLIATVETTQHALSTMIVTLSNNPSEFEKLRQNRQLIPSAVKEILRWSSPVKHFRRTAVVDTVLGGQKIAAGDKVVVWFEAANRDPAIWQDADKFRVDRYDAGGCPAHLAFSAGAHHCMGWRFGEAEVALILTELLDHLPDIHVAGDPVRLRSNFVSGYKSLPVAFTPRLPPTPLLQGRTVISSVSETRKGLIFCAIPDNGQITTTVGDSGTPQFHVPNTMILPDRLMKRMEEVARTVWFPPTKPVTHDNVAWVVNFCADADEYRKALRSLDQAFGATSPIFNHPRAVAMSRRDLMAQLLQGVQNLTVPRCVRFKADSPDSFAATFATHGFAYPVLVRPEGSQTGQGLHKIDGPQDWARLALSNGYGKWHFMTQFHDTRAANGRFCKVRASFVGGQWAIRAFRDEPDWLITGTVGSLTPERHASIKRNVDALLDNSAFKSMLDEIGARVPLDFFGADIGVTDGKFTFFEANAAMTMAKPSTTGLTNDPIMQEVYKTLEQRLIQHLLKPAEWRAARHNLPSVDVILG